MATAHSSATSPPEQRLRLVLLSISRQAEHDLVLLSSHDPHTRIHALRVRMKKLRAILRLIAPGLAPATIKAIRRSMRVLKQAFAMHRDQHVLNALLAELSAGDVVWHDESIAPEDGNGPNGLPGPAQLRRLKATAHALTRRLQTMRLRPLAWDDLAKAYARRYAKAGQWFRRCEHKPSAARLHRWRAPVKDHYFQSLLMLRDRHRLNAARKLGSLLGQIHDLAMLREHYSHGSCGRLARAIHRKMKNLRARIFRKARHLFVLKPREIARLTGAAHKIGVKDATEG